MHLCILTYFACEERGYSLDYNSCFIFAKRVHDFIAVINWNYAISYTDTVSLISASFIAHCPLHNFKGILCIQVKNCIISNAHTGKTKVLRQHAFCLCTKQVIPLISLGLSG